MYMSQKDGDQKPEGKGRIITKNKQERKLMPNLFKRTGAVFVFTLKMITKMTIPSRDWRVKFRL